MDGRKVLTAFELGHLLSRHHAVVSAIPSAAGRQPRLRRFPESRERSEKGEGESRQQQNRNELTQESL